MSPEKAGDILSIQMPEWIQKGMSGQIAYFGGTFTGLSMEEMRAYLEVTAPYVKSGAVNGVRISTHPNYINEEILSLLTEYNVTHIELGVQSMDDEVLLRSGRNYTAKTVEQSAQLIKRFGFVLGLQMMPGLPGDAFEKSMLTAQKIVSLGARETRIYPTVVLKGTRLEFLYQNKKYTPLGLEDAVSICANLKQYFEENEVAVLKIGLHSGAVEDDIVAGPFHPAFGQLVNSRVCLTKMIDFCEKHNLKDTTLQVVAKSYDISDIVGQHRTNQNALLEKFNVDLKISKKVLTNDFCSVIL